MQRSEASDSAALTSHVSESSTASGASAEPPPRGTLARGGQFVWLLLLLASAATALPMYAYTARAVADRDPFIYAQIGKEILAGKNLYTETWIDKPPLGLLMYAAPQIIAPRSYQAIVLFGSLAIVAQALLFAYAFRESPAAALATFLFLVFYPLKDGTCVWPSTEHFSNLFVTGNVLIALSIVRDKTFTVGQCLAAGALAVAAFHVRQNTILCGLLPALAILLTPTSLRERLLAMVPLAAGAAAALAVMVTIVAAVGDVQAYFFTVFVYPRAFAGAGSYAQAGELLKHFLGSPLGLLTIVFVYPAAEGRYRWLVVAAVIVGVGGCLLTLHNHPHYMANAMPYVALIIGLGASWLRQLHRWLPWFSAAAIALMLLPAAVERMNMTAAEPNYLPLARVAAEVDRLAPENATLLVCGPIPSEAIQFASQLPAANIHCWIYQFRSPWKELLPKPWDEILNEYLAAPPGAIVVDERLLQEATAEPPFDPLPEYLQLVRALLARHSYQSVATLEGYVILRRAD